MPVLDQETLTAVEKSGSTPCGEQRRLLHAFADAFNELLLLHESRSTTATNGGASSVRFQALIRKAKEKEEKAKDAYASHARAHGCVPFEPIR